MKIIVAIAGKSGSGKDTIAKALCKRYPAIHNIISCTTRPPRDYEKDGVDYHFITDKEFYKAADNGEMLEISEFNHWNYGTRESDIFDGINVGVFNPEGLDSLADCESKSNDIKIYNYYLHCDDKIRMLRLLNREENPNVKEIIRRWKTDDQDFALIEWCRNWTTSDWANIKWLENSNKEDMDVIIQQIAQDLGLS